MAPRSAAFKAEQAIFDVRAAHLYLAGNSIDHVASTLGCSHGKVAHSLRRTNTPKRAWGWGGSCGKKMVQA